MDNGQYVDNSLVPVRAKIQIQSHIVRAALRDYLSAPAAGRRPAERVRGLIGCLDSGLPVVAEQHRRLIIQSLTRGQ